MGLLIKRLLDAGFVTLRNHPGGGAYSMGMQLTPQLLMITDRGRDFVNSLGLEQEW
jgi:hypothetical protein